MDAETASRIEACIEMENMVAGVYKTFSDKFSDARTFFLNLSMEEENHATILAVAKAYNERGKLPARVVPGPMGDIEALLNMVKNISREMKSRDVSLKEAVEMALSIENAMGEIYLPETLIKETDDKVMLKLKKLLVDEKLHLEKINDFMGSQSS